jgi:hypothetical protein
MSTREAELVLTHGKQTVTVFYSFTVRHGEPANVKVNSFTVELLEDLCAEEAARLIDEEAAEGEDAYDAAREVMRNESRILAAADRAERERL